MTVLLTGAAGFVGYHVVCKLASAGYDVVGLDNLNDYYDPSLKLARLSELGIADAAARAGRLASSSVLPFRFYCGDICDRDLVDRVFSEAGPDYVIHLAAQAGVRYSIEQPRKYITANLVGFFEIMDAALRNDVLHFLYASSSSVYGASESQPFSTDQKADRPISLYAATKRSNELLAHSYSHLHGLPMTGMRFFTVYGPWGRPDMAPYLFVDAVEHGRTIRVFNNGNMSRDFTFADDAAQAVVGLLGTERCFALIREKSHDAPHRVLNIGCGQPVGLMDFIAQIERATGKTAQKVFEPMQPGDVPSTFADTTGLTALTGFTPAVALSEGIDRFVAWYRAYQTRPSASRRRGALPLRSS